MPDQKPTLEYATPPIPWDFPWWLNVTLIVFTSFILFGGWVVSMILFSR